MRGTPLPLLSLTLWILTITGCTTTPTGSGTTTAQAPVKLRIGYGKGGNFNIMRLRGTLEKRLAGQNVKVEWINFPMGPQAMEAIGTRSLEIGSTAATPPLFAQAAGIDFVYAANTPPGKSGSGGAIIVPIDSPLRSLRDLKGKRVAFQPGAVWQYLLIKALEREGMQYSDIIAVKMPPADATAAFHSGSIDAWVQGEPYLTLVQQKGEGRILVSTKDIPTSGGFILTPRTFAAEHPELIQVTLDELRKTGDWARQHPHEAATMTAQSGGLDVPTLEQMIRQQENTELRPVDASVIALQQEQADYLTRLKILPRKIAVQDAVLSADQYARILPPPASHQEARAIQTTSTIHQTRER
ncbi:MAG: aliphatic sulfonate ABC transporter substrate-binding protein [Capsulimonadales bacterium]|nr:aliphatic sulfonate ABC transporter substrate-binding protein [Capsulimonadales bacterium]